MGSGLPGCWRPKGVDPGCGSYLEDGGDRRVLLGWPWDKHGIFHEDNEKPDLRTRLQFASWRCDSLAVPVGLGRASPAIGVLRRARASHTPAFHPRAGGILDLDLDSFSEAPTE